MCMQTSGIRTSQKWRWAGDEIVDSTIPASRKVPGSKIPRYPIDIREFLSIEHNTVVKAFLHQHAIDLLQLAADRERFWRGRPGNFDFRVQRISRTFRTLHYIKSNRRFDQWLFPEETLAQHGGDCEDLAFLLAALLEEAGVSADCIRVALGVLVDHAQPRSRPHDHAWVVYQTEHGIWCVIDPVSWVREAEQTARGRKGERRGVHVLPVTDIEYIPYYVFNRDHLWRIRSPQSLGRTDTLTDYLSSRHFWEHFNPAFAKAVHESIYKTALTGISEDDLDEIDSASLWIDVNMLAYDPRDHFDFAYIDEGWQHVRQRLDTGVLHDFALAVHAIGDFYAHSLYGHITTPVNGKLPIYDSAHPPAVGGQLDFLFEDRKFSPRDPPHDQKWAKDYWSGQLISGQWWRWFTTYPDQLKAPSQLVPRRCLPDHDQLAVDKPHGGGGDHLYDPQTYEAQFQNRYQATIVHIGREWDAWQKRFRA